MHIEFLVEEPSTEAVLRELIPRIVGPDIFCGFYNFRGKLNLLKRLPDRLRIYANWRFDDVRVVVLIDRDRNDCRSLKAELERITIEAGLTTRSTAKVGAKFQVLNRLAIEELEAWFFGDIEALCAAYPRLSKDLANRKQYRNPDTIKGGTWEALERELQSAGYHKEGLGKIAAAREIAKHMQPERNTSPSFQAFYQGLLDIIQQES